MNIKKYEAFIRAVELGSLSKAAEELGYTQSGISHMMQSLEEEVGFPLLVRTSSGILPNAEGETLLPAIRRLLRTNDALAQTIAQIKGADSGRVRVIAFSSAAACWLPEVICRFQRDFPHVEVMLRPLTGNRAAETVPFRPDETQGLVRAAGRLQSAAVSAGEADPGGQ